ncbi:hypothetical protein NQ317_015993, partial [Molorchus minor]
MFILAILTYLLIDKTVLSHELVKPKCCKSDDYLQKGGAYKCTENASKRLGILSNETDFLETQQNGECIDIIDDDFGVFQISAGNVTKEEPLDENYAYFTKCCPLRYYYNTVLHSCVQDDNITHDFINDTFIRVGLPTCKLIVDRELGNEIDLYKNVINVRRNDDYCIDVNEKGNYTLRQCREDPQVCNHIKCVKKCCPDGQSFVNGAKCVDTYTHGINLTFSSRIENPEDSFAVISNRTCKRIYIMNENRYIFKLLKNGTFTVWYNYTNSFRYEDVTFEYSYCIEHSHSKKAEGFFFFKCYDEMEYKKKFEYTVVPKVFSCIFLGLTIAIYIFLRETRVLFGKILLNYCVATLIMFSILVIAQVDLSPPDIDCKIRGYSIVYFATASFAWLNIMCCDIWWTFGSTKQSIGAHQRRKDLKRLLWYLLYAWGMPICLTLIIYIFNSNTYLPYSIHPYIGENQCFLERRPGNYAQILFLRLPHLIIQIVNTVLFFKTILYCLRIKNEINRINDTSKYERKNNFKKDRERLFLILKLSVIMGVTFVFDATSSFFDMSEMGVFIFIIFICKKKIYTDFLKKTQDIKTASINQQAVRHVNNTNEMCDVN